MKTPAHKSKTTTEKSPSYEKYIEIMVATEAAATTGKDISEALNSFGLNIMDWSVLAMYWNKKEKQEIVKYHSLYLQYYELYSTKYGLLNENDEPGNG